VKQNSDHSTCEYTIGLGHPHRPRLMEYDKPLLHIRPCSSKRTFGKFLGFLQAEWNFCHKTTAVKPKKSYLKASNIIFLSGAVSVSDCMFSNKYHLSSNAVQKLCKQKAMKEGMYMQMRSLYMFVALATHIMLMKYSFICCCCGPGQQRKNWWQLSTCIPRETWRQERPSGQHVLGRGHNHDVGTYWNLSASVSDD